ncbi:MAG TPA: polyprenol monophosphomannose synthase [Candidatus Kapabacteria bacterium]|nr:polyprenol monophosphomannose synthase [Candidatus Kapabacteria bacterium]
MKRALIIIPTYNEADNAENIIRAVLEQERRTPDVALSVLIVDDNSPDGTADIVRRLQADSTIGPERLHLVSRSGKMGLGTAYVAGFKYGLEHQFDYLFEMDADFSHDPEEIPNFLREIQSYDLVLGSRYITGANVANWPLRRLLLSYYANKYARLVTGIKVYDATGGFKCFRREVLEAIDLNSIHSNGYSFQIEMNFRAWRKKFKIKEIPIVFVDRRAGTSKMNKSIVREAMLLVWKLKLKAISGEL